MHRKNKKAFTFIEMIISVSIIVLLAVVWNSYLSKNTENSNNTKVISDLETLDNSLTSYSEETWNLPLAGWNNNFFKEDTSYVHSWEDPETFWAHGFITQNTIPKKYLNYLPLDPITKQYYWYWRTKKSMQLEISGVIMENWEPKSVVNWNYTAEEWPYNLIREFNGPDFVYDWSKDNFPYNPDEKILTAKIEDYNWPWIVTINSTITDIDEVLAYTLMPWDKIEIEPQTYATIYFSDWSTSILWDEYNSSELILSNMTFTWDTNLITQIKLVLWAWTIWNKATNLSPESAFEVYTTDTSAAVRWTIFWMSRNWDSNVTVQEWKVKVEKISSSSMTKTILNDKLYNNETILKNDIISSVSLTSLSSNSEVIVNSWDAPKWLSLSASSSSPYDYDAAINNVIPVVIQDVWELSNAISPKIESYNKSIAGIDLKLKLNEIFKIKSEYIKINISWNDYYLNNNWWSEDLLTLTWGTRIKNISSTEYNLIYKLSWAEIISLSFCKEKIDWEEKCSREKNIKNEEVAYTTLDLKTVRTVDTVEIDVSCNDDEVEFKWSCIENSLYASWYTLVAYAPYDEAWDINMYNMDEVKLPIYTDYIVWWGWYKNNSKITSSDNDKNLPSYCTNKLNTSEENVSFCKTLNWNWIFIDSESDDDYLKYDIWSLNLWSKFAIEINAMGSDLKRSNAVNQLYSFIDTDWKPNYLWLFFGYSVTTRNTTNYYKYNNIWLNINSKYKITALYDEDDWNIKTNNDIWEKINYWVNLVIWDYIYIWSNYGWSDRHWDWIIYDVKIYKK